MQMSRYLVTPGRNLIMPSQRTAAGSSPPERT